MRFVEAGRLASGPCRHGDALPARHPAVIGVHSVRFVAVGPTIGPCDQVDAVRDAAQRQLGELAGLF